MRSLCRALLAVVLVAVAVQPALAQQQRQPDPSSPRYKGVVALEAFIESTGDEAVAEFVETNIAAVVRESMTDDALSDALVALRAAAHGAGSFGAAPIGPLSAALLVDNADGSQMRIEFELDEDDTDRFTAIRAPGHAIGG
jgi:hypothetical protein